MQFDLTPFFEEYANLVAGVNQAFDQVQSQYPDEVSCTPGCCDCCYALFDLTLVEAMALNRQFHRRLSEEAKKVIWERADTADRETYRIKHQAFKARQKGVNEDTILEEVGKQRVRCPLLDSDNLCALYEDRPITCRLYGLPLSVQGQVHTCAQTGFEPGREYPAVYLDPIQDRLMDISKRMVQAMPTKYKKLHEVLVPVSMALLNEYDDEYLGIITPSPGTQAKPGEWTLGPEQE